MPTSVPPSPCRPRRGKRNAAGSANADANGATAPRRRSRQIKNNSDPPSGDNDAADELAIADDAVDDANESAGANDGDVSVADDPAIAPVIAEETVVASSKGEGGGGEEGEGVAPLPCVDCTPLSQITEYSEKITASLAEFAAFAAAPAPEAAKEAKLGEDMNRLTLHNCEF